MFSDFMELDGKKTQQAQCKTHTNQVSRISLYPSPTTTKLWCSICQPKQVINSLRCLSYQPKQVINNAFQRQHVIETQLTVAGNIPHMGL